MSMHQCCINVYFAVIKLSKMRVLIYLLQVFCKSIKTKYYSR